MLPHGQHHWPLGRPQEGQHDMRAVHARPAQQATAGGTRRQTTRQAAALMAQTDDGEEVMQPATSPAAAVAAAAAPAAAGTTEEEEAAAGTAGTAGDAAQGEARPATAVAEAPGPAPGEEEVPVGEALQELLQPQVRWSVAGRWLGAVGCAPRQPSVQGVRIATRAG